MMNMGTKAERVPIRGLLIDTTRIVTIVMSRHSQLAISDANYRTPSAWRKLCILLDQVLCLKRLAWTSSSCLNAKRRITLLLQEIT